MGCSVPEVCAGPRKAGSDPSSACSLSHYANSHRAIEVTHTIWQPSSGGGVLLPRLHAAEGDAIVHACREEARRAATGAGGHATLSAVTVPAAGPAQVEAWLQEQQACTANEQHAFCVLWATTL